MTAKLPTTMSNIATQLAGCVRRQNLCTNILVSEVHKHFKYGGSEENARLGNIYGIAKSDQPMARVGEAGATVRLGDTTRCCRTGYIPWCGGEGPCASGWRRIRCDDDYVGIVLWWRNHTVVPFFLLTH